MLPCATLLIAAFVSKVSVAASDKVTCFLGWRMVAPNHFDLKGMERCRHREGFIFDWRVAGNFGEGTRSTQEPSTKTDPRGEKCHEALIRQILPWDWNK